MRTSSITLLAAAFTLACADAPTSTLLEPTGTSTSLGKAPPPWALIEGELLTDGEGATFARLSFSRSAGEGAAVMSHAGGTAATFKAWLLVTPGNQAKLLRFTEGGTATFSNGAMLTNINGKVSGRGTVTVGGHTYELSSVTEFDASGECAQTAWNYDGPVCASFEGEGFSSDASVWTGILSNNGGGPGWDGCDSFECVCINCEDIVTNSKRGRR